jgi:hypothetical protein
MYDSEKVTAPTPDGPTHELIDKSLYNLFGSIARFEETLDRLEGGASLKEKTSEDKKQNVNVVSIYKNAPKQITAATERIHMLIDRLQNQFS